MRALRLGGLALLVAATAVLTSSCPEQKNYPDELVATFSFEARPSPGGVAACLDAGYSEVPLPDASFTFVATYSGPRNDAGELTVRWMTLGEFVRNASFDGQLASSAHSALRTFSRCDDAGVDEQFTVAFVSLSQHLELQRLGIDCPANPLAPGAMPFNPDSGITRPGPTPSGGWDSFKACGVLVDTIRSADGNKPCAVCTMSFDVKGGRQ